MSFWSGVPVSSSRRAARNCERSRESLDSRSFMRWASSMTMYFQLIWVDCCFMGGVEEKEEERERG